MLPYVVIISKIGINTLLLYYAPIFLKILINLQSCMYARLFKFQRTNFVKLNGLVDLRNERRNTTVHF